MVAVCVNTAHRLLCSVLAGASAEGGIYCGSQEGTVAMGTGELRSAACRIACARQQGIMCPRMAAIVMPQGIASAFAASGIATTCDA